MSTRLLAFVSLLFLLVPTGLLAQKKTVKDLRFHNMEFMNWVRFGEAVPEVTDRVILPIGTQEPHGIINTGSDITSSIWLAEEMYDDVNAIIAPPVPYGHTGVATMDMAGAIDIREDIFEEYLYDIMSDLARWGFKNCLVINGHGGNMQPARRAAERVFRKTGMRSLVVEWWDPYFDDVAQKVYGLEKHTPGHAGTEETALAIAVDPALADKELLEREGKEILARTSLGELGDIPSVTSLTLYAEGNGYPDFDVQKARRYAQGIAAKTAELFLDAIRRWEHIASFH